MSTKYLTMEDAIKQINEALNPSTSPDRKLAMQKLKDMAGTTQPQQAA